MGNELCSPPVSIWISENWGKCFHHGKCFGGKKILQRNVFFNTWVLICTGENGGKSFSVENASGERTLIRAYFNILFAEFCIHSNFILMFKVEAKDFIFMVLVSIVWRKKQYFLQ